MELTKAEHIARNEIYLKTKNYDALYRENGGLINHLIKKFSNVTSREELVSLINLGFVKAVKTFDSTKEANFITYYMFVATNEILMEHRRLTKPIHMHSVSYDYVITKGKDENGALTLLETLVSDESIEDDIVMKNQIEQALICIEELPEKQRLIIKKHFLEGKTQTEISAEMNTQQSYVCKLEKKALATLRDKIKEKNFSFCTKKGRSE